MGKKYKDFQYLDIIQDLLKTANSFDQLPPKIKNSFKKFKKFFFEQPLKLWQSDLMKFISHELVEFLYNFYAN